MQAATSEKEFWIVDVVGNFFSVVGAEALLVSRDGQVSVCYENRTVFDCTTIIACPCTIKEIGHLIGCEGDAPKTMPSKGFELHRPVICTGLK